MYDNGGNAFVKPMHAKATMELFQFTVGESPLVAAAIHHGHLVSPEAKRWLALDDAERLREEDPFTGLLTEIASTRLIGQRSRFEFDLNRQRDKAVYLAPEDAWGLEVWRSSPPRSLVERSLANYDAFYATVEAVLRQLVAVHGRIVVLDIHSYNHCRDGADCPPADSQANPEVNVGTGTMDRDYWASVVDGFIAALADFNFLGRRLDVRENIKFRGGEFSRWIHQTFPRTVCSIAVEFKKCFMNEWTGLPDNRQLCEIQAALTFTAPVLLHQLSGQAKS